MSRRAARQNVYPQGSATGKRTAARLRTCGRCGPTGSHRATMHDELAPRSNRDRFTSVQRIKGRESCSPVSSLIRSSSAACLPYTRTPVIGRESSHCGTFERALRQVAGAPSHRDKWTGAFRRVRPESPRHHAVATVRVSGRGEGQLLACLRRAGHRGR